MSSAQNPIFDQEDSAPSNYVAATSARAATVQPRDRPRKLGVNEITYESESSHKVKGGFPLPIKTLIDKTTDGERKFDVEVRPTKRATTPSTTPDLSPATETPPQIASDSALTPVSPAVDESFSAETVEQAHEAVNVAESPPPSLSAEFRPTSSLASAPPPVRSPSPPESDSTPSITEFIAQEPPPVEDPTVRSIIEESVEVFAIEKEVSPLDGSQADEPEEEFPIEITEEDLPTYQSIVEHLYEKAIIDTEETDCCGSCCQCCCIDICTSVDCGAVFSSARNRSTSGKKLTKEVITPALRKGREVGFRIISEAIFPLFRGILRDVWIISEWAIVLAGLSLSIVSFALGNRSAFNILHLALAILAFVLASLDAFFSLRECVSCKECKLCVTRVQELQLQSAEAEPVPTSAQMEAGLSTTEANKPRKCWSKCKGSSDIIRIIATELLLYPLLVCDLFEFILGKGWEGKSAGDRVNFALFILGILGLIFYVYLMRLYVLASAIHHIRMIRKPKGIDKNNVDYPDETPLNTYDPSFGKASLYFQSYFFVHVFLQMLVQICMLIAISIKIQVDNENVSSDDDPVTVSGALWFMLAAGYVMPIIGILTFFLVTYYWVQYQLPNSIVIDLLSILEMPGADNVIFPKASTKHVKEKVTKIAEHFSKSEIVNDLRSISFMTKFSYAFSAPVLVILCLMYTACQLGFAVVTVVFINTSTYTGFYVVAGFFGVVANLYVFAVAALWTVIINGIILAVAIVIAVVLLYCLLVFICAACSSSESDSRRTY